MSDNGSVFSNAAVVSGYAAETPRKVPGLSDLHRMIMLLLSEHAKADAHILVVGAGGGMELRAMAEAQPGWHFTGVDPSAEMLALAREHTEPFAQRMSLIEGTVDAAPETVFAGACCLLTLHFLDRVTRLATLKAIHSRLQHGAKLVVAHHCAVGGQAEPWLVRSAAFADRNGGDWERAAGSARTMAESLPLLTEVEEEALIREAGFEDVQLFYAAFSFRGWVVTAN
jgi:tRNA (cmo5U34)-methyltransferase